MRRIALAATVLFGTAWFEAAPARTLPDWLDAAVAAGPSVAGGEGPALDLLREERRSIAEDGSSRRIQRRVTRVWTTDARRYARDGCAYSSGSDRIIGARAWEIGPDGSVLELGRKQANDRELSSAFEVYSEARWVDFDLSQGALPGAVIAWEFEIQTRDFLRQCIWPFQDELPVQVSRFTLRVPRGWRIAASCLHGDTIAPRIQGDEWSWERHDLRSLIEEVSSPPTLAIAPSLGVTWAPPAPAAGAATFHEWTDVGRWLSALADPQADADAPLREKTRALVAGAPGARARTESIGRFVQGLPYAEIALDLDRGLGYQPRPASQVLRQGYGDCKDKANLMRAMLREAGIASWLVLVNAGTRGRVSPGWPSLAFDHCIVAIRAPWGGDSPAALVDPAMGPLLFFDPTNAYAPVGAPPSGLDGEPALIAAGDSSRLVAIPGGGPDANSSNRECRGAIEADGTLRADVVERSIGEPATRMRAWIRGSGAERMRSGVETWVSRSINAAEVSGIEARDQPDSQAVSIGLSISAPRYATRAGDRMMMVRGALLSRRVATAFDSRTRRLPVWLEPEAWSETTRLRLPPGFGVDELPAPADIRAPFARYAAKYEVRGDTLTLHRSCVVQRAQIPAERYSEVRDFYLGVAKVERAMVVLQGPEPGK